MSPSGFSTFTGELGLIGLFDLSQLLMLNRASGCVTVTHESGRGYLYFREGRIVNALDDARVEGETAAYHVLSWRAGRFEFRPGAPGCEILIEVTTETLLLEAARRADEASAGGERPTHEAQRLRERHGQMAELREAFQDIAREADNGEKRISYGEPVIDMLLESLREPEDRLLLRPGFPAVLWNHVGTNSAGPPLTPTSYRQLRERLLKGEDPSTGIESALGGLQVLPLKEADRDDVARALRPVIVQISGEQSIAITCLETPAGESLWISPANLPPPDPTLLRGPIDRLTEIIELPRALLLAASATPSATRRLLHTLLGLAGQLRRGVVLFVSEDRTHRFDEEFGIVVQCEPAAAIERIRLLRPETVVIDSTFLSTPELFEAMTTVPVLIAPVVANDLEDMLALWIPGLPAVVRVGTLLRSLPVGLVMADTPASSLEPMTVRTRLLDRPLRALRSRGVDGPEESLRRAS